jgi:hypothetical protein
VSDEHDDRPSAEDAVRLLQERLDRASDAAERLISEAAGRMTGRPPPAGWQRSEPVPADPVMAEGEAAADRAGPAAAGPKSQSEPELLLALLRSLREVIPPELQHRLGEALREVLVALRALIDWYLERTEHRRREPAEVQDIPIS